MACNGASSSGAARAVKRRRLARAESDSSSVISSINDSDFGTVQPLRPAPQPAALQVSVEPLDIEDVSETHEPPSSVAGGQQTDTVEATQYWSTFWAEHILDVTRVERRNRGAQQSAFVIQSDTSGLGPEFFAAQACV